MVSRHTDKVRDEDKDVLVRLIILLLFHNGTCRSLCMTIHRRSVRRAIRSSIRVIHARLLTCCSRSRHALSSRRMAECDKVNGVYVMDTAPTDRLRSTRGLSNPLMSSLRLPRFERAIVAGFRGFTVVSLLSLVQLVLRRKFNSQSWVRNRFVEKRYELKKVVENGRERTS